MAQMVEIRDACGILVGKPKSKRALERPSCRCDDNIKMNVQEVRLGARIGLMWFSIGRGG